VINLPSINNTHVSNRAFGEWRIMPHSERANGPITTRAMTTDELEKYGQTEKGKKPKDIYSWNRKGDKEMKIQISNKKLLEYAREIGTSAEAARTIAEKEGLTQKQVENLFLHRKIKEMLIEEQKGTFTTEECKTEESTSNNCISEPKKCNSMRLMPRILMSQQIPGFEYDLRDEHLNIYDNGNLIIEIDWENLKEFIQDLQELRQIVGE
jgi:hypothetical protein